MRTPLSLFVLTALGITFAQVNAPPTTTEPDQPVQQMPIDPSVMGGTFEQMVATAGYQVISTPQDVVTVYNVAAEEILIAADAIVAEDVADAIRRAMVERGVNVYILTRKDTINLPESYVTSLQQAGAKVRVSEVSSNFALIDRKSALMGAMSAGFPKVSVQLPIATIDPELEAGTDMLEYFYDTNAERRRMMEDAFAIIQENAPETDSEVEEIVADVEQSGGYNKIAPTNEMYQQCQEQLSSSSIASLLTNGSIDIGGHEEDGMQPVAEGEANAGQTTPLLAENACYEYAEPTGLTTMILEPTYVNELIGGYYQAYELADDYGG